MSINSHRTAPENVSIHDSGWLRLASGAEITKRPLRDVATGGAARMGGGVSQEYLRQRGMRLPTPDEYRELRDAALHVDYFTMPTSEMLRAQGIGGRDTDAVNRFRTANMMSLSWCNLHDKEMDRRLSAAGYDGTQPVANDGKHYAQDDDGEPVLTGGYRKDGTQLQEASTFHRSNPDYADYMTNFHAVRDCPADDTPAPPDTESDPYADTDPPGPPRITSPGDDADDVRAHQRHLVKFFAAIGVEALPKYGPDGDHGGETEAWTQRYRDAQAADPIIVATPSNSEPPAVSPRAALLLRLEGLIGPFRSAGPKSYGKGRPRGDACGVCWHTAEIAEVPTAAESLGGYTASDPGVSWNYAGDNNSITYSVRITDRAYAAGPGNDQHVHIEWSARANQGRAGWADAYSVATMDNICLLTAWLCVENGWPIDRRTPGDFIRGDFAGICDHYTWTKASQMAAARKMKHDPWWNPRRHKFRRTTHTDMGPTFPWDKALALVAHYAAILRG